MTPEEAVGAHDFAARATYDAGKWPLLVDVRCPATYRGRSCGKQMARVLNTPRGPLFVMVVDGGTVAGVDNVPPLTVLDLLEFRPDRLALSDAAGLFGRCRRHVGTLLDRNALMAAAREARRSGKVVVHTPAEMPL